MGPSWAPVTLGRESGDPPPQHMAWGTTASLLGLLSPSHSHGVSAIGSPCPALEPPLPQRTHRPHPGRVSPRWSRRPLPVAESPGQARLRRPCCRTRGEG